MAFISAVFYVLGVNTDTQFLCLGVGNDPREDRYFSIPKQVSALIGFLLPKLHAKKDYTNYFKFVIVKQN